MASPDTFSTNRLKVISIAAAFLQIIVCIILITNRIFFSDSDFTLDTNHIISKLSVCAVMVYYVVNIVSAGYFIYTVFLNEPDCVMYNVVLLTNIVILLLNFKLVCVVLAALEIYIFCCSAALQRKYGEPLPNDPENPPPTYNSCNNDSKMPLAGPSSQSDDAQVNSEANTEIVSDTQVDTPKNTTETSSLN